jgi:quinol monooxygenase YgiN
MRLRRAASVIILPGLALLTPSVTVPDSSSLMMVRVAEIDVEPRYLDDYVAILKKEAAASVQLEPGVICIFPMAEQAEPTRIRLLEIYASRDAYEAHLQSPHFLEYKSSTLPMIKSLRLVEMSTLDASAIPAIFKKRL